MLATLGLGACANPITNLPFYEDAAYVAALPSETRFGVPTQVRLARVGTSKLLADAVAASADMQDHVETVLRSGEVLRSAEPDERTDVARSWDGVQVAGDLDGERFTWWARGEVVRIQEGGDVTWAIDVAPDPDGPWSPVGSGRHDPSGYGTADWDLQTVVELLAAQASTGAEVESVGQLALDYEDDFEGSGVRAVTIEHSDGPDLLDQWTAIGPVALAWFGPNTLSEPERAGAFQIYTDDGGGWGLGELYDDDATLDLITCWSPVGDTVYASGSLLDEGNGAVLSATGSESDCPLPYPF